MLFCTARCQAASSQSRKSPGGGPPELVTRMSGSGQAWTRAARPSARGRVGRDRDHLGGGGGADLLRGPLERGGVAGVKDDSHALLRQRRGAAPAQALAGAADDGRTAGYAEIHGVSPCLRCRGRILPTLALFPLRECRYSCGKSPIAENQGRIKWAARSSPTSTSWIARARSPMPARCWSKATASSRSPRPARSCRATAPISWTAAAPP